MAACRRMRLGLAMTFALAGAACAPSAPLYAPLAAGRDHGYSEQQLSQTKYAVTYVAPPLMSTAIGPTQRDAAAQRRVGLAYDMALWRAAELASRNGYPAFAISDRTNTVTIDRHDYNELPEPPHCYTPDAFLSTDCPPFTVPRYLEGYDIVHARVSFNVELQATPSSGSFDAKDMLAKLQGRYPNAEMIDQDTD